MLKINENFCWEEKEWLCSYEYLRFQLKQGPKHNAASGKVLNAAAEAYIWIVIFKAKVLFLLYANENFPGCLTSIKTFFNCHLFKPFFYIFSQIISTEKTAGFQIFKSRCIPQKTFWQCQLECTWQEVTVHESPVDK